MNDSHVIWSIYAVLLSYFVNFLANINWLNVRPASDPLGAGKRHDVVNIIEINKQDKQTCRNVTVSKTGRPFGDEQSTVWLFGRLSH